MSVICHLTCPQCSNTATDLKPHTLTVTEDGYEYAECECGDITATSLDGGDDVDAVCDIGRDADLWEVLA